MSNNELKFVVFIINKFALAKNISVAQVYYQFDTLKILDNYILKHYDVLHTLGENYLIDDLTELLSQKALQK